MRARDWHRRGLDRGGRSGTESPRIRGLATRTRGLLPVVLVVWLLLAFPAHAGAAGTNIGDAQVLSGGGAASGSLPSAQADDWYVVYPASPSAQVTVEVKNTTPMQPGCQRLIVAVRDPTGSDHLGSQDLAPGTQATFPVSGYDRYFVEINDGNCNPGSSVVSYTVQASGPFGEPLRGANAQAPTGGSIGDAREPLTGHLAYQGSIPGSSTQQWLVFDIATANTAPVSVRVEDTTVAPSGAACTRLIVDLDDTDGNQINSQDLAENTAYTFTTSMPGRYFISLNNNNCDPSSGQPPVTYDVQIDPASALSQPVANPRVPIQGGVSKSSATGPLAGGVDYTDEISNSTTTRVYSVEVKDTGTAYLNLENTTAYRAPCPRVIAMVVRGDGTPVSSVDLADDTGITIPLPRGGLYYLSVTDNNCDPGTRPPTSVQISISPSGAVTPGPAFGGPPPPTCQDVSASTTENQAATFRLSCRASGNRALSYQRLSSPRHGQASVNPSTGQVTYTPAHGFVGNDSFSYNAATSDGEQSAVATASITVRLSGGAKKGGGSGKGKGGGTGKGKGGAGKGKTNGGTPSRSRLKKILEDNIKWLKQSRADLKVLKDMYSAFIKAYDTLKQALLKNPALKRNFPLQALAEAVDVLAKDVTDEIDRLRALEERALKADQALLDAIKRGQRDITALYRAAVSAANDESKAKFRIAQGYRGFLAGYRLVTKWITDNTAAGNNPILKQLVKQSTRWMEKVLKDLQRQSQVQDGLGRSNDQLRNRGP